MRAKAFQLGLVAVIGGLIGTGVAIDCGWRIALAAAAVVVLIGLAVRAFRRGHRKAEQIFREELDDPDPFAMSRRVEYRTPPTDTTGETR